VVKNSPCVAVLESPSLDLNKATITAQLVYDTPGCKPVDYLHVAPLESFVRVYECGGSDCSCGATVCGGNCSGLTVARARVELRVRVLTSQHEDCMFRVRFVAITSELVAQVLTPPMRVISKAETRSRKSRQQQQQQQDNPASKPKRGVRKSKLSPSIARKEGEIVEVLASRSPTIIIDDEVEVSAAKRPRVETRAGSVNQASVQHSFIPRENQRPKSSPA